MVAEDVAVVASVAEAVAEDVAAAVAVSVVAEDAAAAAEAATKPTVYIFAGKGICPSQNAFRAAELR